MLKRVERYQRDKNRSKLEEKRQYHSKKRKDRHKSTKHYNDNEKPTNTNPNKKPVVAHGCSGRVCSTCDIRRVAHDKYTFRNASCSLMIQSMKR